MDIRELARQLFLRCTNIAAAVGPWVLTGLIVAGPILIRLWSSVARDDWSRFTAGLRGPASLDNLETSFGGEHYLQIRRVAEFVETRTAPDETLVVFTFAPEILYLSGRTSPSRFFVPRVIFPYKDGDRSALWRRWQAEFIDDVLARPPRFFIFGKSDLVGDWDHPMRPREMLAARLPEIEQLLRSRYRPVDEDFSDYLIYERPSE